MSSAGARLRLAERASCVAGLVVATGGALALAGWAFDLTALTTPLAGGASMKANTAVCLVLAGVSLALGHEPRRRSAVRGLATTVMLIGLLTLSEYALGYDLGIDELLFRDAAAGSFPPGRMSPTTAVCFFAFGLAVFAEASTRGLWLAERLALLVAFISGIAVVGYLYHSRALYGVVGYTTMAVHTALLILLLAVGLLLSRSLRWIAVMVSDTFGGAVARRLLPIALLAPVVLGWLQLQGQRAGWYGNEFGLSLIVIATIVVFVVVIWSNAKSLIAMEGRERDAKESLSDLSRFRALLDAAPDAIVIVNRKGTVVLVNRQVDRLFGYQREELVGQDLELLIPERIRAAHTAHRDRFFQHPSARPMGAGLDLYARKKDGTEFPAEISLSPIDSDGQSLVIAAVRDVTDRQTLQRRLQASLDEKELLLKEVHHRVKNNLQVIASMLRLQAAETAEPAAVAALTASQDRVQTIAAMHESLYQSEDLGIVDIEPYVNRLAAGLLRTHGVDSARIAVHVRAPGARLTMDDAVTCGLLINELLSNALKYAFPSPRTGVVVVAIHVTSGGLCEIEVADTGVGLPPGFDLQASKTLGLEIVRTLIAQMDGTLRVDRHHGTKFRLTFQTAEGADV